MKKIKGGRPFIIILFKGTVSQNRNGLKIVGRRNISSDDCDNVSYNFYLAKVNLDKCFFHFPPNKVSETGIVMLLKG
jgi:hypothetical protein